MVILLPEVQRERRPSFGEQFGAALGSGIGQGLSTLPQHFAGKMANKRENEALKKLGIDLTGISDPDIKKALIQGSMRKKEDKKESFQNGIEVINAMREIASRKNIGRGSSVLGFFPGETATDRAEFEQLGKSLIPLVAAGVPIRNQKEFEEYKKVLTNPSSQLSEIEGALNGLERIFAQKLAGEDKEEAREISKSKRVQFNPSHPEHKAKAQQLYKTLKDKEKVREALQREFEGI